IWSYKVSMFGTRCGHVKERSEEETVIEERALKLADVHSFLTDLKRLYELCNIFCNGNELSLGNHPLSCVKPIIEGHINTIEELGEDSSSEFQLQEPLPAIINPEATLRLPEDDFIPEPEKRLRVPSIEDDEELASRWPQYGDEILINSFLVYLLFLF
ncbi:hypothetical protein KM1_332820, partial [Entamoeba histolytica HM-3:IMSS]